MDVFVCINAYILYKRVRVKFYLVMSMCVPVRVCDSVGILLCKPVMCVYVHAYLYLCACDVYVRVFERVKVCACIRL